MLLQLFSVFGPNLRTALDLIDRGAVNKVISESTKEEFFQVKSSSDVTYIILTSSWRCSCPAWFQVGATVSSLFSQTYFRQKFRHIYIDKYFDFHVCLSIRVPSVCGSDSVCLNLTSIPASVSLTKVVWYVLNVKNMHPGSPSTPVGLLPPRQSRGAYTQF